MLETNTVEDRGKLILIGDFNIHMDSMNHPDTIIFNDCLDSLNLINLVDFPMHGAHFGPDHMWYTIQYCIISK